jgi:hypothetical protein
MTCLHQQVNEILLERAFGSASVMKMFTVLVTMKYVTEHVIELKRLLLLLLMPASTRSQVSEAEAFSSFQPPLLPRRSSP